MTEVMLLEKAKRVGATRRGFKNLAVPFAVDDFGTDHTLLSYLHLFPLDVIKIDRRFIEGLKFIAGGRAITQAIPTLDKAFGFTATAKCVETDQRLKMLMQANARGTGFPVRADDSGRCNHKIIRQNQNTGSVMSPLPN